MASVAGGQGMSSPVRETSPEHLSARSEPWSAGDVSQTQDDASNGPSETRCCELCGATTTPMWRRGPSGKGTVCNACGVRWASRRRAPRKHADDSHSSHANEHVALESGSAGIALEQYYCKYCGVTWPLNYFKNRQQFGAHCSNCSRKRKSRAPPPPDVEFVSTSPRESASGSSPTGPLLPHLNLRAAANAASAVHGGSHPAPRKMPRSDIHLMNVAPSHYANTAAQLSLMHNNRWDHEDFMDEFSPPHKRSKFAPSSGASSTSSNSSHTMNTNISVESGDETYNYESDSETALSPYGPSATSLHRLLGAVENVLTEEREMAMTLAQLEAMRTMIDSVEETRKRTLGKLESALMHQLNSLHGLTSAESLQATITEKQRADEDISVASAPTTALETPVAPPSTPASSVQHSSASIQPPTALEKPAEDDSKMQVDSAPPTAAVSSATLTSEDKPLVKEVPAATAVPHVVSLEQELPRIVESQVQLETAEAQVEAIMGPLRDGHHSVLAPSLTLPLQLLASLPPELENAAVDLSSVFANATLLQLGSQADVDAFKQGFVQSLAQSKVIINQEVAMLFETLGALKSRQTQLGQNTFIDQLQLRGLSSDLHELKQRVVHASCAVQNAFVQLVSRFSEQIETAKRIYQESAGNNVKLLDEIIRAQMTPQLISQIDLLKRQLLAHVNCVRANLAYLDTLVLNTE